MGNPKIITPPKPCQRDECSNMFERRANETVSKFAQRKYCSPACRNEMTNARNTAEAAEKRANTPAKPCAVCGESFERRETEAGFRFSLRQTCGPDCAKVLRRKRSRVGSPGTVPHNAGTAKPRIRLVRYDKPRERNINDPIEPMAPPVRFVRDMELPVGRYCPTPNVPQAENLTQAERTERRLRFRDKFQEAS